MGELGTKRGQASTEFLIVIALVLLLFSITSAVYFMNMRHAGEIKKTLEATELCLRVSSTISSFTAIGGNSTYRFSLPEQLDYGEYDVWIAAGSGAVRVDYGSAGTSCMLSTRSLSHSNGSTLFMLEKNATMHGSSGVLTID